MFKSADRFLTAFIIILAIIAVVTSRPIERLMQLEIAFPQTNQLEEKALPYVQRLYNKIAHVKIETSTDRLHRVRAEAQNYIDMSSVDPKYKLFELKSEDSIRLATFINSETDQLVSFRFSKDMRTLNEQELRQRIDGFRRRSFYNDPEGVETAVEDIKWFKVSGQDVPYARLKKLRNGKPWRRALFGVIPNYNGKRLVIQSNAAWDDYSEEDAIEFYQKLKLHADKF